MTPEEIALKHVCPGIGSVLAILCFGSPLPALLAADRTKQLKGMNPLPLVAMAANCTLGSIYGQITTDPYIYFPNMTGVILSWFYVITAFKLLSFKEQDRVLLVTLAAAAVLLVVGSINLFHLVPTQTLWGSTAVAVLGLYYIAPLTSIFQVIRTRDSSSIYWPLCLANLVNAVLWFVYGMAQKDWFFIAMPNAMGAAFNTASLMLCLVLPRNSQQTNPRVPASTGGFMARFMPPTKPSSMQ